MSKRVELADPPPNLDFVRACGHGYAGTVRRLNEAHATLVGAVVVAYSRGASVTELADASGLSRRTVYKALARPVAT